MGATGVSPADLSVGACSHTGHHSPCWGDGLLGWTRFGEPLMQAVDEPMSLVEIAAQSRMFTTVVECTARRGANAANLGSFELLRNICDLFVQSIQQYLRLCRCRIFHHLRMLSPIY
jgi:hypothetical protein